MNRHSELWAVWNVGTIAGIDLIVQKHNTMYIGYLGGKGGMRSRNPGALIQKTLTDLSRFGDVKLNYDEIYDLVVSPGHLGAPMDKDKMAHLKSLCQKAIRDSTSDSAA